MHRLPLRHALLALALVLPLAAPAAAQNPPGRPAVDAEALLAPYLGADAARLQADLAAYADQPGYLWRVADAVQRTATAEQRQALLDAAGPRAKGERRSGRGGRAKAIRDEGHREQAREIRTRYAPQFRALAEARREQAHAARAEVLGLTADQQERLGGAQGAASRKAMAEVLTPAQQATAEVHRALARLAKQQRRAERKGPRAGERPAPQRGADR